MPEFTRNFTENDIQEIKNWIDLIVIRAKRQYYVELNDASNAGIIDKEQKDKLIRYITISGWYIGFEPLPKELEPLICVAKFLILRNEKLWKKRGEIPWHASSDDPPWTDTSRRKMKAYS